MTDKPFADHAATAPSEATSSPESDESALHAVIDQIVRAQGFILNDAPYPPTPIALAMAVNVLASAVLTLASRTLGGTDDRP